jgi:AcrR family transcriptional regulator
VSDALDHHILKQARRLFTEQGYAGTSIEQLATVAGVGKQSIYRRYASKEELFKAVLTELGAEVVALTEQAEASSADPVLALRETLWALSSTARTPETIALYRSLIAEAKRFPEFAEQSTNRASTKLDCIILRLLRRARENGAIDPSYDETQLHRAVWGLFGGWDLQQKLVGAPGLASDADRGAFFETAWRMFLEGAARR